MTRVYRLVDLQTPVFPSQPVGSLCNAHTLKVPVKSHTRMPSVLSPGPTSGEGDNVALVGLWSTKAMLHGAEWKTLAKILLLLAGPNTCHLGLRGTKAGLGGDLISL